MLLSILNNFNKKIITSMFLLFNFIIADPTDGCDIDDFSLFLTSDGQVLYNSSQPMAGFQFDVEGGNNTYLGNAYGGDAQQAGFTVSTGNSTVIGFSFSGALIPAGCGTLTNLEISGPVFGVSSIVISDPNGQGLDFSYYEGGNDDGGCDDIDGDGVCDDVDDCVGTYDECGVCNGAGIGDDVCDCDGTDKNWLIRSCYE